MTKGERVVLGTRGGERLLRGRGLLRRRGWSREPPDREGVSEGVWVVPGAPGWGGGVYGGD